MILNPDELYKKIKEYNKSLKIKEIDPIENYIVSTKEINDWDNSIVVVLSHANTERRKEILKGCIKSIEKEKVVVSNYPIDPDIQNMCNWSVYTNKNEILLQKDFQKYNVNYSYHWVFDDGEIVYVPAEYEHGYAVYCLIRRALLFCKGIGKENIHIINYDYIIPSEIIEKNNYELLHNELICYDTEFLTDTYTTGIFSGKIDTLLSFFTLIKDRTQYYKSSIYGVYSTTLEEKFTAFFKNQNIKIKCNKIKDMPENALIDMEKNFPSIEIFIQEKNKKKEYGK